MRTTRAGSDDWVERVRAASDIAEIIGQHVALKRVGRNWTGLCPFHPDKSPSFSVNTDRQFYHCFSCGAGGDVFKFLQEFEKISFPEALEALSRRAGIPVPASTARQAGVRGPLLEALEHAATAYQQWLHDPRIGRPARDYLESRGVLAETVRDFRLGLAPAGWENLVQRLAGRVPEGVLLQAGLAARREGGRGGLYDRFRHRLMVPLFEPGGKVVGFGARDLGEEGPKYLNSPETAVYHKGAFLYGLDRARKSEAADQELILVEGYFDAIALHQAGVDNVVATSGTALTADQARLLRRRSPRALLTYDGDAAGQEAMLRSLGVLLAEGLEVRVADLPPGEDPDGLVRRAGREGWEAVRAAAHDPVEFIKRRMLRAAGPGDARERALQAVVRLAAEIADPVRVRMLLERAEQAFQVAPELLERARRLQREGASPARPIAAAVRAQRSTEDRVEWMLVHALLRAPEVVEGIRARIALEDFQDPEARSVAAALWTGTEVPDLPHVRALLSEDDSAYDWVRAAEEYARKVQKRRFTGRMNELRAMLAKASSDQEKDQITRELKATVDELSSLYR